MVSHNHKGNVCLWDVGGGGSVAPEPGAADFRAHLPQTLKAVDDRLKACISEA